VAQSVPSTPIVEFYDSLDERGVGREKRLACAAKFVVNPASLAKKFGASVRALEDYLPNPEGFYRSRPHYAVGDKRRSSTIDLALRIRYAGGLTPTQGTPGSAPVDLPAGVSVVSADQLGAAYLDREVVPGRTTGGVAHGGTAVRLDLLLRNATDRTPVVAEIKRTSDLDPAQPDRKPATDKDPFSALVQALAATAQLASPPQYARLARWGQAVTRDGRDYPEPADIARVAVPLFDIYLVLHNRPTGTYLKELGEETARLSGLLLAQPAVARHVRRIACMVTHLDGEQLLSKVEWAYERTTPGTARVEGAFAAYFRPFAITLPGAAALELLPGSMNARGWSIRWRWHADGSLEFRAGHRMTNESWHTITPDGRITDHPVPSEFFVVGPDEKRAETEYRAAWRAHHDAVEESGMSFDASMARQFTRDDDHYAWKPDGGDWTRGALAPRH
jgi:hypothetical protein